MPNALIPMNHAQSGAGLPVTLLSARAVRECLPTVDLQYDYHEKLKALAGYTKDKDHAIAMLEAQVAMAETLPEAMERGDVKAEREGNQHVYKLYRHGKVVAVFNGNHVNLWRQLAAVPEEARQAYYQQPGRPTRNGLLKSAKPIRQQHKPLEGCEIIETLSELVDDGRKFRCIYADPPWAYSNAATRASVVPNGTRNSKHGRESNYKAVMSVDQICEEPVAELAEDESHLYLWTTTSFLPDAFRVIDAWGFTYKTNMVWVKPQMGIGNYVRVSHEHLLIAVRGGLRTNGKSQKSWVEVPRMKHSRKPSAFRRIVEAMSQGPYLEMYGREQIEGWTVYGNEIETGLFDGKAAG